MVDNLGQTTVATAKDTIIQGDRPPVVVAAPASITVDEGQVVQVMVSVTDADGNPITALSADLSQLPGGHNATFTKNAANTSGTLTWTPIPGMSNVVPYDVTFTASNALSGTAVVPITVQKPNVLPNAALAVTPRSGNAPLVVTADASSSSDPDGSICPISSTSVMAPSSVPRRWRARVTRMPSAHGRSRSPYGGAGCPPSRLPA